MANPNEPITPRQTWYLGEKLNADRRVLPLLTKGQASRYIDAILEKDKKPVPVAASVPNSSVHPTTPTPSPTPQYGYAWTLPISPENVRTILHTGYYAWRSDDTKPLIFLRVKMMTYGKNKGNLKISTQHGPEYKDALTVYASGQGRVWRNPVQGVIDAILGVMVAQTASARAYAKEKKKCCICNTDLTVWRSRWYGIGPECEKSNERVINDVDDEYGFPFEDRFLHGYTDEDENS